MNMELILACLGIMGKGMIGIFVVILVIWGLVALLNKVSGGKKKAAVAAPAAPAAAETIPNRGELIAAVSAALAEEMGTDISAIRITSFKKVD